MLRMSGAQQTARGV